VEQPNDPYDLVQQGLILNVAPNLSNDQELKRPGSKRFKKEWLKDLEAEPEPKFAIQGVLKRGDLAFFYGPAKTYKTFAALDMAVLLAKGPGSPETPNKFARQFEVNERWKIVYITNEGGRFIRYRLRAAAEYYGLTDEQIDRLIVIREVPNLFDGEGLEELIEVLKEENADLIIFDTFARVTVGADENTTKDMGVVLENIGRLKHELGGPAILIVHHANKDGGLRGSTLLQGAVDLSIKFALNRSTRRATMRTDGMKDGAEFDEIEFTTVQVGDSPRYRAIEWIEPSSMPMDHRKDIQAVNSAKITAHLQEDCNGIQNAATVPDIALATGLTAPTVRKHFSNLQSSETINGVRETKKRKNTKQVLHYYWDSNFEARS
jgi:hypothetical protein